MYSVCDGDAQPFVPLGGTYSVFAQGRNRAGLGKEAGDSVTIHLTERIDKLLGVYASPIECCQNSSVWRGQMYVSSGISLIDSRRIDAPLFVLSRDISVAGG